MRSIIPDYLTEVLAAVQPDASGEPAGYIPELAAADPERLSAAFAMIDGEVYGAGDIDTEFTIQRDLARNPRPSGPGGIASHDRGDPLGCTGLHC
ncbi:glutaminase [Streptomyces sp. st140]|uniref:glutaminase n=1 Tax=Streptomyces sp. st140 TaxID=1828052 RepID=UPI000BF0EB53|nr:glutaminase [Streptomyces sp. st140]